MNTENCRTIFPSEKGSENVCFLGMGGGHYLMPSTLNRVQISNVYWLVDHSGQIHCPVVLRREVKIHARRILDERKSEFYWIMLIRLMIVIGIF